MLSDCKIVWAAARSALSGAWLIFSCAVLLSLMPTALAIVNIWLGKVFVDGVLIQHIFPLSLLAVLLFCSVLLSFVTSCIGNFLSSKLRVRVVKRLTLRVVGVGMRLTEPIPPTANLGRTMSLIENDIQQVSDFIVTEFPGTASVLLGFTGAFCLLIYIEWRLAMLAIAVQLASLAVAKVGRRPIGRATRLYQETLAETAACCQQALAGSREIKVFCAREQWLQKLSGMFDHLVTAAIRKFYANQLGATLPDVLLATRNILVMVVGGGMTLAGELTLGGLLAFMNSQGWLVAPASALTHLVSSLHAIRTVISRIAEYEALPVERSGGVDVVPKSSTLSFKRVHYKYPDGNFALSNVSFSVRPGEVVAMVGRNGSGKTTVGKLALGLLLPTRGNIYLEGQDVAKVSLNSLRRSVTYVPQDPFIFIGSLRDNVGVGDLGVTSEEVEKACFMVGLGNLFTECSDGLDMPCGEGGFKLSGGQRQRLAFARALVRRPRVLVMDEPTGSQDPEAQEKLWQLIRECSSSGMAVLLISHDISMAWRSDRVIVLDGGSVVQEGSPAELFARDGIFREFCLSAEKGKEPIERCSEAMKVWTFTPRDI